MTILNNEQRNNLRDDVAERLRILADMVEEKKDGDLVEFLCSIPGRDGTDVLDFTDLFPNLDRTTPVTFADVVRGLLGLEVDR